MKINSRKKDMQQTLQYSGGPYLPHALAYCKLCNSVPDAIDAVHYGDVKVDGVVVKNVAHVLQSGSTYLLEIGKKRSRYSVGAINV